MRLAIACLLFTTLALAQDELLPNGGFEANEKAPDGWGFVTWSGAPSRGQWKWAEAPHSDKRAVSIVGLENAPNEAVRSLLYSMPVTVPGGLLRLTGTYKTSGASTAHLQVMFYSAPVGPHDFTTPTADTLYHNLAPAPDWTPFALDLGIKPGVKQVVIMLRAMDLGEVSFDDVSLKAVTEPLTMKLYPAEYGRGVWPLVEGAPSFVRIMLMGDRSQIKQSAEILLDLPAGVGDFGLLGPATDVKHGDTRYSRHRIPIPADTLKALEKTLSHVGLTIWLSARHVPEGASAYVRAVVDGQELPERSVALRVLPPLPDGPRPTRFGNLFCWSLFWEVPEKLWADVYAMSRSIGVSHVLGGADAQGWRGYLQDHLRADGGHVWANAAHALETETYQKGAETRIIAEGKAYFERVAGEHYRKSLSVVDGAFWDWEPANAARNPLWDDPATVQAFAAREKLDPATLTPARLQGELRDRFLAFRTWQQGELLRLWAAFLHDLRPDLTVAICQGSGMPPDRAIDYRAYDDIPHLVHLPMIYTASPLDFARNVAGLRGLVPQTPLFPMTSTSMLADGGWPAAKSPRAIYFDYVTSALQGCMGCSHWADLFRGMDMEYVWEISRAMRDVGAVESFVFDGQRSPDGVTVEPLPESEARLQTAKGELRLIAPQWDRYTLVAAFRCQGQTLAAVCNMHPDKPAAVLVRDTKAKGQSFAYDPVTMTGLVPAKGQSWSAADLAKGVMFEVPPQSLGMLVLSPKAPAGGFRTTIKEAQVRARFAARQAQAQASGGAASVHEGKLTIDWADVDGDGNAEVHVASPDQELGFGASGNLWSWKLTSGGGELINRFDGAGACQDRFWWPVAARAAEDSRAEYELMTREIKAGRATLTFRRVLTHAAVAGLVIEKTYTIPEQGAGLQVRVTLRNESPAPIEFSYWSHNAFAMGPTPTLLLPTAQGEQTYTTEREIWALMPGLPDSQKPLLAPEPTTVLAQPSFALQAPDGRRLQITTDPSLLQLYRWWDETDQGRYTLEWMYQKQQLVTGGSWSTRVELSLAQP
jgi:hypothetical protein